MQMGLWSQCCVHVRGVRSKSSHGSGRHVHTAVHAAMHTLVEQAVPALASNCHVHSVGAGELRLYILPSEQEELLAQG